LPSGFVACKFVAVFYQHGWGHIGEGVMPKLSLPPPKLIALVVRGRWALARQHIADVPVNEVAYGVAFGCCRREVPTFYYSTFRYL
jgi:hypothetical protein